jgi:hypothetical protein
MSEQFQFQLSVADILKVVGEHVNRTLLKKKVTLTSITSGPENAMFEFTAIPTTIEPHVSTPRKRPKRGMKQPVPDQDNTEQEPSYPVTEGNSA